MSEKVVLLLAGGGSLGAYQCGAYRVLVDRLLSRGARIELVAGVSIGAINAAIIARHYQEEDAGAGALEAFWRSMRTPSWPFFPFPQAAWQRLNGLLTGTVFGQPSLFHAVPGGGIASIFCYPFVAPYDTNPMVRTLRRWVGRYEGGAGAPRLLIKALDVERSAPVWFDSDEEAITPEMLAGSASMPPFFPPRQHAGMALWDGDVWPEGLLPGVFRRLHGMPSEGPYRLIHVELFRPIRGLPVGLPAMMNQFRALTLGGKLERDDAEYAGDRGQLPITRIRRTPPAEEGLTSPLFDWAPEHIDDLIAQGRRDAIEALDRPSATAVPGRPHRWGATG